MCLIALPDTMSMPDSQPYCFRLGFIPSDLGDLEIASVLAGCDRLILCPLRAEVIDRIVNRPRDARRFFRGE